MLKEKIQEDLKKALKDKREIEVSTLRVLLASVSNKELEKRTKIWKEKPEISLPQLEKESALSDAEIMEIISFEIKKRKEAILAFEKGKREDLVRKENSEIAILRKYLPEPLSEEEIKILAKKVIEKLRVKEIKEMGKIMSEIMPKVKGRADGALVSKIVKDLLNSLR